MEANLESGIRELIKRYPQPRGALLPALHLAQKAAGGAVSRETLAEIAVLVGVPLSTAFGVQSYYTMFNLRPTGRYHLQVDTNIPAMLAGAREILAHLEQRLGIKAGETTPDGLFTLSEVEDLASCGTCPVIQVNDRYYESLDIQKVDSLLDSLRAGVMPDWPSQGVWASTCDILLKRRGSQDPSSVQAYQATGGYVGLDKALTMTPAEILAMVKGAGVRGRGGAGFPLGMKMGFVPKDTQGPVYLVCNADEGEPGTFKDRQIMEYDPHLLIEGMIIAGKAIGAKLGFIYIRGEFAWIADILDKAADRARAAGLLGAGIGGTETEFDIIVHLGAGAYVCGEETALIESIEGKRGNPRLKPPFPAVKGLWDRPTVVTNVETLANLPWILEHGVEAYRAIGLHNNFGPKIYGVSGHVNQPGAYEMPLGTPLSQVIQAAGGVRGTLKAVIVGGLSAPILTAAEAEGLLLDYDSCIKKGTMLGSGGVMVMNETTSIPEIALRAIQFYAHESCGQCVPCRQGSHAIHSMLKRVVAGTGTHKDLDTIERLCATIPGSTLCPTGEAFSLPIGAMLRKFRAEFEALVDR